MSERQHITVEGIVDTRNDQPYVVLRIDAARAQLTVAAARKIAADLQQMASRIEADAMIIKFFGTKGFPAGASVALMKDFRDFRLELDKEPVEGFHEEPTEGTNE